MPDNSREQLKKASMQLFIAVSVKVSHSKVSSMPGLSLSGSISARTVGELPVLIMGCVGTGNPTFPSES